MLIQNGITHMLYVTSSDEQVQWKVVIGAFHNIQGIWVQGYNAKTVW